MIIIFERELSLLDETGSVSQVSAVQAEGGEGWELRVFLKDKPEPLILVNWRKEARRWAQLNTLIKNVSEICSSIKTVTVQVPEKASIST